MQFQILKRTENNTKIQLQESHLIILSELIFLRSLTQWNTATQIFPLISF